MFIVLKKINLLALVLIAMFFSFSCATSKAQYSGMERYLHRHDFKQAIAKIKAAKKEGKYEKKDRVLYWLDLGMLESYDNQFDLSNKLLTNAENTIEDLYTKSIRKEAGSLVLNDNIKDYIGEDYENIYINVFKSLNYTEENKIDDAMVEIRKVQIKLNLLHDKYNVANNKISLNFSNSALAHYLSLLFYRNDRKFDDANIDKKKIDEAFANQPNLYNFAKPELPEIDPNNYGKKAYLNVISFAGLGPQKVASTTRIQTYRNAIRVYYEQGDENARRYFGSAIIHMPAIQPGYNFKFEFPTLKPRKPAVSRIELFVDGNFVKELQLLENMAQIAKKTFEYKQGAIIGKTLTRAVIKYIATVAATEATKKATNTHGFAGALLSLGTSLAVSATEQADLRMSYFFPATAFVTETVLTPGTHRIEIRYYKNGRYLYHDVKEIDVKPGKLNLVRSFYF